MRAVLMAGGRGSRLAPLTTVLPKPLMPLGDRPIIDVLIRQLVGAHVSQIDISVGHLGGLIEAWVRHEAGYGVPIGFLYEDAPLGTAGALRNVPDPGGTFLAMNGDILTDLRFRDLVEAHEGSGAVATMAVKRRDVHIEYGVVHTDVEGRIMNLEEKPTLRYTVSMGVYAFNPRIIDLIGEEERIDFPDLLLRAIGRGETVGTYAFDGYWRDIGNRDDYEAAIAEFADDEERFFGAQTL
jgi:NDP-sugar pyrophosphorylase family protein